MILPSGFSISPFELHVPFGPIIWKACDYVSAFSESFLGLHLAVQSALCPTDYRAQYEVGTLCKPTSKKKNIQILCLMCFLACLCLSVSFSLWNLLPTFVALLRASDRTFLSFSLPIPVMPLRLTRPMVLSPLGFALCLASALAPYFSSPGPTSASSSQ